jgi:hypothetical protein
MKANRAALYLRVSTDGQTTENQRRELEAVAAAKGWNVVAVYEDAGISGANGRDKRPGFDRMLKDAVRREFDVLMAWSVDRLGRSLLDLISALQELHGAGADLFLHQQAVDTSWGSGHYPTRRTGSLIRISVILLESFGRVIEDCDALLCEQRPDRRLQPRPAGPNPQHGGWIPCHRVICA